MPTMFERPSRRRKPDHDRNYGSIPINRAYEVVRYAMPLGAKWAITAFWIHAVITTGLAGATLAAKAQDSSQYFVSEIDLRVLVPLSLVQVALLPVSIWLYFRIVRHSKRALIGAFVTAGLIATIGIATLVLVKFQISGYEDYPLQFREPAEFILPVLHVFTLGLLCTPSLREWCDDA